MRNKQYKVIEHASLVFGGLVCFLVFVGFIAAILGI